MSRDAPSFEECLTFLGVGLEAGRKGARRAYLKLLRTHKPEVDPEGFKRLRTAWEKVDAEIDWRIARQAREARREAGSVESAAKADSEEVQVEVTVVKPAVADHPDNSVGEGEEDGQADSELEEMAQLIAGAGARLIVRHQTVPDWAQSEAEAFAAEHDAASDVLDVRRLAAGFGASPHVGVAYAEELLDAGHPEMAAHLVQRQLELAQNHAELDLPHPYYLVQMALRLTEDRAITASQRVVAALDALLERTGAGARLGDEVAALWLLARELDQLAPVFPEEPRALIATAVRQARLTSARGPLEDYAQRDPAGAEVARALLFHRSPNLHHALSDSLRPRYGAPETEGNRRLQRWGWFALLVSSVVGVAFLATRLPDLKHPADTVLATMGAATFADTLPRAIEASYDADRMQKACSDARTQCRGLVEAVRQLDAGACDGAVREFVARQPGLKGYLAAALRGRYLHSCK